MIVQLNIFDACIAPVETKFFRLIRRMYRWWNCGKRPGSFPFVTGDTFRELADHIYDETTDTFDASQVCTGDLVFVSSPKLREFLRNHNSQINHKYILVEHNGDDQVEEDILPYMEDSNIYRFYAQCALVAHPKITPIPIGVENLHHGNNFKWIMRRHPMVHKIPRVFYHFAIETNPDERGPAKEYFKTHPLLDTIDRFIPTRPYKKILNSYMFTASPAGNTLGSHRTWEALYLHTIPIVKRTPDSDACVANGLPLWVVKEWTDLETYTEEMLSQKYKEMMKVANFESLYMDYWINRIRNDQQHLCSS